MKRVFIADAVRTPWGKPGKSLDRFIASDLSAPLLKELLARTGVAPETVDQVIFGQAHPSTYPNNIGHYAWLKAELPVEVPGYTVQANSASALQALRNAYYLIATGNENICIAGGTDSYSAAPFVMRDVRNHFYPQHRVVIDSLEEAEMCTQPVPMTRQEVYEINHGKEMSEEAKLFSVAGWEKAQEYGNAKTASVVSMFYTDRKKGEVVVSEDEWIKEPEDEETALSPYADGAAATMLMSESCIEENGLTPKAEILGFAVAAYDPAKPHRSAGAAMQKLLRNKGKKIEEISCFEIIENSAEDVMSIMKEEKICTEINPFGGALSFGKNDGAEGLFMLMRLMDALKPGELGVACIYSAGGQSIAVLVQKC